MFTDVIIMAGGSGTRLWPASNTRTPKQFLTIPGTGASGASFFRAALERAFAVLDSSADSRVLVIAGPSHGAPVMNLVEALPQGQRERLDLLVEPTAKNTGPAVACGTAFIQRDHGPHRTVLVLTSDHIIDPLNAFVEDAKRASEYAQKGQLVVFGIPPTRPETGYGYIEADKAQSLDANVFPVTAFREKPDRATAERFVSTGRFYWNSGMFAFSADFMAQEFKRSSPATWGPFETLGKLPKGAFEILDGFRLITDWKGLAEAYGKVKPISIDYAVAEKCSSAVVIPASYEWLDIGSWDEYAKLSDKNGGPGSRGVYVSGSENCFVDSDVPVALCGVQDLIVVARSGKDGGPPSVLICKKGETQRVKEIVDSIKAEGRTELL